jgi:hypothetical protein
MAWYYGELLGIADKENPLLGYPAGPEKFKLCRFYVTEKFRQDPEELFLARATASFSVIRSTFCRQRSTGAMFDAAFRHRTGVGR